MNHEAKVLVPLMSIVNIVLIVIGGKYHLMSLGTCIVVTKVVLFVMLGAYAVYNVHHAYNPHKVKHVAEAIEKLTPRTPRETCEITGEELPPPFAQLTVATLVTAEAVLKGPDDE